MHLAQYFVRAVKRFPEATAVVDDQVRWSYRNLYQEVSTVAANVQQLGVKQGDHVLVVLKNHRENLLIYSEVQTSETLRIHQRSPKICGREDSAAQIAGGRVQTL